MPIRRSGGLSLVAAVLCFFLVVSASGADRGGAGTAGIRTYLIEVTETATAAQDIAGIARELAQTYSGRLELFAAAGFHGFAVRMSPERARLLAADPRVKSVREAPSSASPKPEATKPATNRPSTPASDSYPPPIEIGPYKYDAAGNIIHIGSDRYTYDGLSRVVSGTAVTPQNSDTQQFTYDGFGNLEKITIPNKSTLYVDVNSATNKLKDAPGTETGTNVTHTWGGGYDAAGNQTRFNGTAYVYAYDNLSMVAELNGPRHEFYLYDGEEQRVATVTYTNNVNATWRYTIRSPSGNVLRQITDTIISGGHSWRFDKDYVYRGGALLSSIQPSGVVERREHFHLDHLGTPVLITDDAGVRVSSHKYWPFGADAPGSDADSERMKFAGQERDLAGSDVNALDYLHARYYSSNSGRFLSADPGSARAAQPQSWNRFAYVRNNPLALMDPSGQYDIYCIPGDVQCNADAARFEQARQAAANESDPKIKSAAQALGTLNDHNGVYVQIREATADEKKNGDTGAGSVLADISAAPYPSGTSTNYSFCALVRISPSVMRQGLDLEAAVAHEGQHVLDAKNFFSTFSTSPDTWNLDKNLTHFDTEMNAYRVTQAVYNAHPFPRGQQYRFKSGDILKAGMSAADVTRTITTALANPANGYNTTLNHRQLGNWDMQPPPPVQP